ncbi:Vitamin B12 import ATP-binding protein BtuD [Sodalis praecaptivus]
MVQCLFGVYPGRWEGEITLNGAKVRFRHCRQAMRQGIAMVPEDRKKDGIIPVMGVCANITLAALDNVSGPLSVIDEAREQSMIDTALRRLRVKTASPALAIGRLSGANQQKAILAKCLLLNPQILILDEPTRGIDIGAKQEIYLLINQLVQQGIAVIVISSELPEVLGISDRVLAMHQGFIKADLPNRGLTQEQVMEAALRSVPHVETTPVNSAPTAVRGKLAAIDLQIFVMLAAIVVIMLFLPLLPRGLSQRAQHFQPAAPNRHHRNFGGGHGICHHSGGDQSLGGIDDGVAGRRRGDF